MKHRLWRGGGRRDDDDDERSIYSNKIGGMENFYLLKKEKRPTNSNIATAERH